MKESALSQRFYLIKILILAVFFGLFLIIPQKTYASISACSVSISSHSVNINSTNHITFTVTNNDDSGGVIRWLQFNPPDSNYSFTDNSFFSNLNVVVGGSIDEIIGLNIGNTPEASSDWLIQASDNSDGIGYTVCSGDDLSMAILDTTPPLISNVVISSIANNSAVITWTTSKNATSELDYGATTSYGFIKSDSNPSTSHTYTLSSLSSSTTYHFNIKATDEKGTTELGDNSFITAQTAIVTLAPQIITNTTTTIQTVTPTPSPTPIPDTTAPIVYVSTDFSKPFAIAPQVLGIAKDNIAVAKIEYSLDGGKNWLPVDVITSPNKPSTTFSFIPSPLDDGNYDLRIKATDSSSNAGFASAHTLVIDRLPPQVSGVLFSLGPQIVNPREDGSLIVLANQPIKITLSDVGGATSIDIFVDDISKLNSKKFSLTKNSESGLWSGNLTFPKNGEYQLRFSAIDGAGNKTDRNLNRVLVSRKGAINAPYAKITVYYQDSLTDNWMIWDGKPYLQENPQKADGNGTYGLFLPTGKYYLHIESPGFQALDSEFFSVSVPMPVNADFSLKPLKVLLNLGLIKLYWPDFSIATSAFKNNFSAALGTNALIGKQAPYFNFTDKFSLDSLSGKPSVLTFVNTWSPQSIEQVSILDKFSQNKDFNSATIVEGEKSSKVYVFQKRGGYSLPIVADPDALLVSQFNLNVLPVTYFLDRKGTVKKIISGTLSENELIDILTNIAQ